MCVYYRICVDVELELGLLLPSKEMEGGGKEGRRGKSDVTLCYDLFLFLFDTYIVHTTGRSITNLDRSLLSFVDTFSIHATDSITCTLLHT